MGQTNSAPPEDTEGENEMLAANLMIMAVSLFVLGGLISGQMSIGEVAVGLGLLTIATALVSRRGK